MRSLGKHLHNAWQIIKVAALIALIASAITLIYLVARGWLSFGPYSIILGILGMIIIVVGGCISWPAPKPTHGTKANSPSKNMR